MMNRLNLLFLGILLASLPHTDCPARDGEPAGLVTHTLDRGWSFTAADTISWKPARVPGCVHTDLWAIGRIGDPFWRDNEFRQQWIDKQDWIYRTEFTVDENLLARGHVELLFEGLDTYAEVYVNDKLLLSADNMFRRWRTDVKKSLVRGANELKIRFRSPVSVTAPRFDAAPLPLFGGPNNDRGRDGGVGERKLAVYNRKVQSHFGWDWGPRFLTCGIWRPVRLQAWDGARIADVRLVQDTVAADEARVTAWVEIAADSAVAAEVSLFVDGREAARGKASTNVTALPFTIPRPELWWPNGMGEAHLYEIEVRLMDAGRQLDAQHQQLGLRTVRVVREPDRWGKSFYFEVNGRPMFAKGANWIPTDSFLPRTDSADYRRLIDACVDAHFNMLRVWGGGLYEDDAFYDACDRAGILVWQDFAFACAMYPVDEEFRASVRAEAVDNVRRLRNHASLAMWCGNNEMTQAWYNWGWSRSRQRTPGQLDAIWAGYRKLFFELLPEVVAAEDPGRFYWPSSPSSEPTEPQNYASGDVHYWKYRGPKLPVSVFRSEMGRFMSEWGFNSAPTMSTVETYTVPEDRDMHAGIFLRHVKSPFEPDLSLHYVEQSYGGRSDFDAQLFLGQVHQAEAMKFVIEQHRLHRPFCMGTLYWQLNDCWPGNSWSTIDYFGRWKPAHYAVKRAYAPQLVAADVMVDTVRVYGVNDAAQPLAGTRLVARLLTFTGEELSRMERPADLPGEASVMLWECPVETLLAERDRHEVVLQLRIEREGAILCENRALFAEVKQLRLSQPRITVEREADGDDTLLRIVSPDYALFVTLNLPDGCDPSDNCFDLWPGEVRCVRVKGRPESINPEVRNYLDYR